MSFLRLTASALLMLALGLVGHAQEKEYLWPDGMPNSNELIVNEADSAQWYIVNNPLVHIYPAAKQVDKTVLLIPGGGYRHIGMDYEGFRLVDWYRGQGVNVAILQYRVPNGHPEVPLSDVHRAMKILRKRFPDNLIGVHGFSAGGHLASTAATHYTDSTTRPDFQILFYPVIAVSGANAHKGSSEHLLGKNPTAELLAKYENHCRVSSDNPPAFIVHSADDSIVPVANSLDYHRALLEHKVPATLIVYPSGDHGWCYNLNFIYNPQWKAELSLWLSQLKTNK